MAVRKLNKEQKRPTTDAMAGEWGDREGNVMPESLLWQRYNTRNYLIALNIVNSGNKVTVNAFKNLRHILLTQRNVALKVPLAQQMNQTWA